MVMNLQDIIAELENIIEQASNDEEIEKDAIMEALIDVVRDAKGDDLDFSVEDEDGDCECNCEEYIDNDDSSCSCGGNCKCGGIE